MRTSVVIIYTGFAKPNWVILFFTIYYLRLAFNHLPYDICVSISSSLWTISFFIYLQQFHWNRDCVSLSTLVAKVLKLIRFLGLSFPSFMCNCPSSKRYAFLQKNHAYFKRCLFFLNKEWCPWIMELSGTIPKASGEYLTWGFRFRR